MENATATGNVIDELAGSIEERCRITDDMSDVVPLPGDVPQTPTPPATCLIVLGMAGSGKTTFVEVG